MAGSIHLILGPMYAGKSSELLRRYNRYSIADKKCMLVKYELDTRYDKQMLCTHDSHKMEANPCQKLMDLNINHNVDVICIDEIQFYPDSLEFCEKMAKAGMIIEASGLSGNFKREPFPNMSQLISKADKVLFLTSVCMICKSEGASFTKRLSDEEEEVIIGGLGKYVAVCRKCY